MLLQKYRFKNVPEKKEEVIYNTIHMEANKYTIRPQNKENKCTGEGEDRVLENKHMLFNTFWL